MRAWLLVLALGCSGCGLALQTVIGWREEETHLETRRRPLEIDTEPEGAMVLREGADGVAAVGRGPLVDALPYEVSVVTSTPQMKYLVLGLAAEVLAGGILGSYCLTGEECEARISVPIAVMVVGCELTFTILAARREPQVREIEHQGPGFAYWALSGALRSPRVGVSGRAPERIALALDQSDSPLSLRFPKGTLVSIVVSGALGPSADAALLLAGIEEIAGATVTDLGYRLAPPGIEPVPLQLTVEPGQGECRVEATVGTAPILAERERLGPCRGDLLPQQITGMILELFEGSD